jgi:cytochrome c oxidase subunit II
MNKKSRTAFQRRRKNQQQLRERQHKNRRAMIFAVVVIGVLGLAGYLLATAFSRPDLEPVTESVIDITADMGGFDLQEIRAKVGESVTVRLTSLDNQFHTDGGGKHQWAVDEFDVSVIAQPKGTNMVTFVPDTPGTYTYYCDICCGGRANPSMQGTLVVEA